MNGRSFRESIRVLRDVFFAVVFNAGHDYSPLLLLMTATMPSTLLRSLLNLTNVNWTKPYHQLWSTPIEFQQRYISMDFEVTGDIGQVAPPLLQRQILHLHGVI